MIIMAETQKGQGRDVCNRYYLTLCRNNTNSCNSNFNPAGINQIIIIKTQNANCATIRKGLTLRP